MAPSDAKRTDRLPKTKMAGKNVVGTQKEVTAVIVNLKEMRILEKAVQTLSLEESYAIKLLGLNNKIVRLHYSRLKSNVSKIRSNLTCEDISALKVQESQGCLKFESMPVSSISQSKITAAEKRLNLGGVKRSLSAPPKRFRQPKELRFQTSKQELKSVSESEPQGNTSEDENSSVADRLRRRLKRRPSVMSDYSEMASVLCSKIRPQTSAGAVKLAKTGGGELNQRPSTAQILEKIASSQKARKNSQRQTTYSCHDEIGKDKEPGSYNMDDVFGPNPYEIRRRRLLGEEIKLTARLNHKKVDFLRSTGLFVKENPLMTEWKPEDTEQLIQSIDSMVTRPGSTRVKSGKSLADRIDDVLLKQFEEIRRTRYLRVDDCMLDTSRVTTLAKDQFKLTESWRNVASKARVTFAQAVAL